MISKFEGHAATASWLSRAAYCGRVGRRHDGVVNATVFSVKGVDNKQPGQLQMQPSVWERGWKRSWIAVRWVQD